jgi:hypothetical protein
LQNYGKEIFELDAFVRPHAGEAAFEMNEPFKGLSNREIEIEGFLSKPQLELDSARDHVKGLLAILTSVICWQPAR